MKKPLIYLSAVLGIGALPGAALAEDTLNNLDNMSLESLGSVVTSVSKKPEDSFRAAAAIYVITSEDIKLSGATNIAEALRGVPGLDVAQEDSSDWAISSRGFNGFFANKLLVLIDGRTIYTPLFSGVYWDIQNIPLGDIDRIEVIRGPGASLWGSNAVNGIINIITKNAADTQGTYLNQVVGTQARSLTDVRYGGKINDNLYYRVYAKNDDFAATPTSGRMTGHNQWDNAKAGFRADWDISPTRKITLQGDAYDGTINLDLTVPDISAPTLADTFSDVINAHGMNMLGRWQEQHNPNLQSTFQLYFDNQSRSYSSLTQQIDTFDSDYQMSWKAGDRNDVVWGAGARYITASLEGSTTIGVSQPHPTQSIVNMFVQDQYALIQKELYLTLGSKFEENSFAGFVPEPSARIAWYPDDKQTVWGSVSRAVRTPGITEHSGMSLNAEAISSSLMLQERSNPAFDSEELTAYEVGYRVKPVQKVSIDNTAFINEYSKLQTLEPGTMQGIYLPYYFDNLGRGHAYGFETSAKWEVTPRWNLLANYSYINLLLHQNPASQDPYFLGKSGDVAHHQAMLRSELFLPHEVRFVNNAYYVGRLPNQSVDAYFRFDTQVIWQAMNGLEVALVGQNLSDSKHAEFGGPLDGAVNEIPRAVYARITIRY